jgi:protein tyrosine phosphatase
MSEDKIEWVKSDLLARSSRPGWWDDRPLETVIASWLVRVRRMKIRSIVCLLSKSELDEYYGQNSIDLLRIYKGDGFKVAHIPITDDQNPPLTDEDHCRIARKVSKLPLPWLIHCSAGVDRTGSAIDFLLSKLTWLDRSST